MWGNAFLMAHIIHKKWFIDKNGNEVIAMQMETKGNTTGASLATMTEVNVDVTGFSWTPTAILTAQVAFGAGAATNLLGVACYGQGSAPRAYAGTVGQGLSIVSVIPGVNKVTVRLRNSTAATLYYDNIIVTAVRAP